MKSFVFIFTLIVIVSIFEARDVIYWKEYKNGVIPPDALKDKSGVYIAQIPVHGLIPGTIYPNKRKAVSEYAFLKWEESKGVKILCSQHPEGVRWVHVNVNNITDETESQLVEGGIDGSTILFIGKAFDEGVWKIGKVYPSGHLFSGLCLWTNWGGSHVLKDFQVLAYDDRHLGSQDFYRR